MEINRNKKTGYWINGVFSESASGNPSPADTGVKIVEKTLPKTTNNKTSEEHLNIHKVGNSRTLIPKEILKHSHSKSPGNSPARRKMKGAKSDYKFEEMKKIYISKRGQNTSL